MANLSTSSAAWFAWVSCIDSKGRTTSGFLVTQKTPDHRSLADTPSRPALPTSRRGLSGAAAVANGSYRLSYSAALAKQTKRSPLSAAEPIN
jgi:hypothetical protein